MKKTYKIPTKKFEALDYHIEAEFDEETIREFIKNNPELLTPIPTHKRKYFVPKVGEEYYYINLYSEVKKSYYSKDNIVDIHNIETGNSFETFKDAQDELNRRQSLVRIWNNYDDKYSWDIDWEDKKQKYGIDYDYEEHEISEHSSDTWKYSTELPYFKSSEDRNQFVSENESDLKLIFNIK